MEETGFCFSYCGGGGWWRMKTSCALAGAVCRTARPTAGGRYVFYECFCAAGKPGVAPAGDSLSFASPKESKQRKGDPQSGSLRCASGNLRCSKQSGSAQTRCAQTARGPNPPVSALLSPARTGGRRSPDIQYRHPGTDRNADESQNSKQQEKIQSHKYAPRRVLVGFGDSAIWMFGFPAARSLAPTPLCAKTSSAREGGSGAHMFERSEFMRTPPALSNAVTRSAAKGLAHPARLSFAYFSLAKQRTSESAAGPRPGLLAHNITLTKIKNASLSAAQLQLARPPWRNAAHPAWARHPAPHRPGEKK